MVSQHLKSLGLRYNARVQLDLIEDLLKRRIEGEKLRVPRAMELNFTAPEDPASQRIKALLETYRAQELQATEKDLFAERKRLADVERRLGQKVTKTAEKEKDIAERKIARLMTRLERLSSDKPMPDDSRIYAFDWAPVIIWRDGERVIVPMRYHLRPPGTPEDFDRRYPGCYNARQDSLTGFWRREFGKRHAILVISSFFENVKRHDYERRELRSGEAEENMVLQFKPKGHELMAIPSIWDHWQAKGKAGIDSFALITDDPPPEVAETGHNRCPIFLNEARIDDWLRPEGREDKELFEILGDRQRPFYAHEVAA